MTANGTVIATIPANAAVDAATNGNAVSTGTDNTVTFIANNTPIVTADDDTFSEGTSESYSASWTDSGGAAQTHTCTIDFGDGGGAVPGTVSAQPSRFGHVLGEPHLRRRPRHAHGHGHGRRRRRLGH